MKVLKSLSMLHIVSYMLEPNREIMLVFNKKWNKNLVIQKLKRTHICLSHFEILGDNWLNYQRKISLL
jgi:hypothetical protein